MEPDYTTGSRLGPLPRRGTWLAASAFASLTLVLAGVAAPAVAAAQNADARVTRPGGGNPCVGHPQEDDEDQPNRVAAGGGGGDEHCRSGPPGPTGPRGPKGKTGGTPHRAP
ncbi:hypothetical protein [Streptomyces sp. G-G2]|uniref:hypothetical protein n=1 Tax=Streptomyces sp. G-G2 TaxID=3046201 RepID=UPI0024BA71B3|nr:hypothetical protein [Streptomyces sp. G-G2]MDJ0380342.1 hypothetical protein [Streptomyces sp. G-G2]